VFWRSAHIRIQEIAHGGIAIGMCAHVFGHILFISLAKYLLQLIESMLRRSILKLLLLRTSKAALQVGGFPYQESVIVLSSSDCGLR
jgi:hypothetical protein